MLLLYNSKGDYLAFKIDENVFDVDGRWIGVCFDEKHVYKPKGKYLGTIFDNRLFADELMLKSKMYFDAEFPGYPEMFDFPRPIDEVELPVGFRDVKIRIRLL